MLAAHAGRIPREEVERAVYATWATLARRYPVLLRAIHAELADGGA